MAEISAQAQVRDGDGTRRKPYSPPRVLLRDRVESIASTCVPPTGKTPGMCNPSSISS